MNFQSELSTDLKISRIITGLWQIADIEREEDIDPKAYAEKLTLGPVAPPPEIFMIDPPSFFINGTAAFVSATGLKKFT